MYMWAGAAVGLLIVTLGNVTDPIVAGILAGILGGVGAGIGAGVYYLRRGIGSVINGDSTDSQASD